MKRSCWNLRDLRGWFGPRHPLVVRLSRVSAEYYGVAGNLWETEELAGFLVSLFANGELSRFQAEDAAGVLGCELDLRRLLRDIPRPQLEAPHEA